MEAVPSCRCRPVSEGRVAKHAEQERIRIGGIPILAVVDDCVEEVVELVAAEAAGKGRDEVTEVRLGSPPTAGPLIFLKSPRPKIGERLRPDRGGQLVPTNTKSLSA